MGLMGTHRKLYTYLAQHLGWRTLAPKMRRLHLETNGGDIHVLYSYSINPEEALSLPVAFYVYKLSDIPHIRDQSRPSGFARQLARKAWDLQKVSWRSRLFFISVAHRKDDAQ